MECESLKEGDVLEAEVDTFCVFLVLPLLQQATTGMLYFDQSLIISLEVKVS